MLTVSKPTVFSPDGLAARGQCNHDSPGWQLRWFDTENPAIMVWQGAYKTCRHLQNNCASATSLEEVRKMIEELLNASSFGQFASQPTDAYPSPDKAEGKANRSSDDLSQNKKRRKKRKRG